MIQYCDPNSNHDLCVTKSLLLNGLHFTENNKTNIIFTYKDLYMLIFHSIRYDTYILYWITFLFVILYLSNSSSILRSCIDYSSFILYSIFLPGLFPFHSTFHFPVWIIPLCSTFFSLTNINTNFNKKEFG
jgi:hypothetical protein